MPNTQIHAQLLSPTIAARYDFDTNIDELGAIQINHIRVFVARDEVGARTLLYDSNAASLSPAQFGSRKFSASASRFGHSASHRRGLSRSQLSTTPESSVSSMDAGCSPLRSQTVMERTQTTKLSANTLSVFPHSFDDCTDSLLSRLKAQSSTTVIPEDRPTPAVEKTEVEDELSRACLDCMFGSSAMKQVAATKVHVIPNTARQKIAEVPNWRVHWNSQFTSERPPLAAMSSRSEGPEKITTDDALQSVLITRVFSLSSPSEPWPSDGEFYLQNVPDGSPNVTPASRGTKGVTKRSTFRARKLPTYAVAFLIQMPRSGKAESTQADLGSGAKNLSLIHI